MHKEAAFLLAQGLGITLIPEFVEGSSAHVQIVGKDQKTIWMCKGYIEAYYLLLGINLGLSMAMDIPKSVYLLKV